MTGIDWRVEVVSTLPSTQDAVKSKAHAGAPEGTVVQALVQEQGRGRQGNEWISPLGNLYMSVLLKPLCDVELAGQISFVAALAVSAGVGDFMAPGHEKTLKWPNDILVDGKKCAGILLESETGAGSRVDDLIIGIGVNVLAPPPERVGVGAVADPQKRVAIHPLRDRILFYLDTYYQVWKGQGFEPLRAAWLAQAHGLGHKITARLPGREEKGIFRGIDEKGALLLEIAPDNKIAITSAEVYF